MRRIFLSLRLIWEEALLSYKALFSWLEPRAFIMLQVIQPMFEFTFFVFIALFFMGPERAQFAAVGNAFRLVSVGSIWGLISSFRQERYSGTLKFVIGTPMPKLLVFLGRSFMHVLDSLFAVFMGLIYARLFFGVDFASANWGGLVLSIFSVVFSMLSFGSIFSALGLVMRDVNLLMNSLYALFIVFCGVNFPISYLPDFLRPIGQALPLTHGLTAARALIQGAQTSSVLAQLGLEILIGGIYLVLGLGLFIWMESTARKNASLDLY
ncbi:MAG: ABC transporter permease [Caldiserica bacterium]|jgi:ABC-2 type transport system permease protein|nr:ABC transporter permease [Caldisericota bacterium]MDH7563227.1 ABC transporter permease [Caldisericota bacterium]